MRGASWSWSVRKSSICVPSAKYTASWSLSPPSPWSTRLAAQPRVVAAEHDRRGLAASRRDRRARVANRGATCGSRAPGPRDSAGARCRRRCSSVTASTRWSISGEPKRSSTVASAFSPSDTTVCGNDARPSPSHQCRTRIGSSITTPAGTWMKAPPARNASCSTVNASSEERDAEPTISATSSSSQVAIPHTRTPLASSAGSSSWWTTRPSRTTIMPAWCPASAAQGPPPGARSSPGRPSSSSTNGR